MDYIRIKKDRQIFYGGNQSIHPSPLVQKYGCGYIAAADVCYYLNHIGHILPYEEYAAYLEQVRKYFRIFPVFGMNGFMVSASLNRLFRKYHMPYRSHWKILPPGKKSRQEIEGMLSQGIPVILLVGQNFPNFFGKEKISLYRETTSGAIVKSTSFHKHFLVATGICGEDLLVSSWGRKYRLRWQDYMDYARKHSKYFCTNYMVIERK